MSDEQEIDFGAEGERGDEPPRAKQLSGWDWWPAYQDSVVARRRLEEANMKALNFALDRIFERKP